MAELLSRVNTPVILIEIPSHYQILRWLAQQI